jgi:hypothetical protein
MKTQGESVETNMNICQMANEVNEERRNEKEKQKGKRIRMARDQGRNARGAARKKGIGNMSGDPRERKRKVRVTL